MAHTESTYISLETHGRATVARIECEKLANREAQVIEAELNAEGEKCAFRLVVDLSQVTMLPSIGLGMLVSLHRKCKEKAGRLAICNLSPDLLNVLKLTHLDRLLTICKDREAAIKTVQ
ncbi:MAG: STAS domain-containing protein [Phycisphaerae bacterium]|nr:STAS domain-containing protein [Phycisphaerae bacterium]